MELRSEKVVSSAVGAVKLVVQSVINSTGSAYAIATSTQYALINFGFRTSFCTTDPDRDLHLYDMIWEIYMTCLRHACGDLCRPGLEVSLQYSGKTSTRSGNVVIRTKAARLIA